MSRSMLKSLLRRKRLGLLLAGHGVATEFRDPTVEQVHIGVGEFCDSLDYLQELEFRFISTAELIDHVSGRRAIEQHWVHLGFDDGYINNIDNVMPILRQRSIPLAIYATINNVRTGDYFPTFWLRFADFLNKDLDRYVKNLGFDAGNSQILFEKYLKWAKYSVTELVVDRIKNDLTAADLSVLAEFYNDRPMPENVAKQIAQDPLVHMGSHSFHHIVMHPGQQPAEIEENLQRSFDVITAEWLSPETPTFCFPNGDTSEAWQAMAARIGYQISFGSDSRFFDRTSNPNFLPRFWLSTQKRIAAIVKLGLTGNWLLPGIEAARRIGR